MRHSASDRTARAQQPADLAEANAMLATISQAQPAVPDPGELAAAVAHLPALWQATTSDRQQRGRRR
ncbi:hypothetical protein [Nonomuraea solani]|uniref:hypothetical protein n=1 Tax=Nonomuraea solani TaxID=1144553 RepID=UPI000CDF23FF|nr:hypothetical protein [Nonomuraea solani]